MRAIIPSNMSLEEPAFEIVLDERYVRELHQQWIAACGRGWRADRVMTVLFAALGVLGVVSAVAVSQSRFVALGLLMIGIAVFETWRRGRRRAAWRAQMRTQEWFGRTMTVVLRDGGLVQVKEFEGDPRYARTGEITATPNGWLVRYASDVPVEADPAASSALASVYLPLRALRPQMARDEVERLFRCA